MPIFLTGLPRWRWRQSSRQLLQETQELQVWSLGQEGPLEQEMATHSSILAWRILWTEEPGGLQSMGPQRVRQNWATNTFTFHGWQGNFWDLMRYLAIDSLRFSFLEKQAGVCGNSLWPKNFTSRYILGETLPCPHKNRHSRAPVAGLCIWTNSPC